MVPLTIMSDIRGSARNEDSEDTGVIKADGVFGAGLGSGNLKHEYARLPGKETGGLHWAIEQGARASGIDDSEGVLGEGTQDPTGIFEKFEGLATGVGGGRGDLQVLQSVDLNVGAGVLTTEPGVAEIVTAEETRATREARREECVLAHVVKVVDETTPMEHQPEDRTSLA